jgi:high-affinity iron transporter
MNDFGLALQSGAMLLREGLEAMLIVTALAAALRRGGSVIALSALYIGSLAAVLASVVAAFIFEIYFDGSHNDFLEAVVMIVASALMIYMSGWLFLRQDPRAWKKDIDQAAQKALDSGTQWSLALIAFLAVFREGAETVLFLAALATSHGGWNSSLIAGLLAACGALGGIYWAMQLLALRIPLRPLFMATSAFLFIMGLRFIGGAIQELQEQTLVPVDVANAPDWMNTLGLNPSWEAIGAQLVIAMVAGASIALTAKRKAQGAQAQVAVR